MSNKRARTKFHNGWNSNSFVILVCFSMLAAMVTPTVAPVANIKEQGKTCRDT